jgi:hypothetical protein
MDGRAALAVQNVNIGAINSHKDISKFSIAMLKGPVEGSVA